MSKESLIKKIKKLLALGQSSNENEAQAAILMAQELMAKHQIEMSQVKDASVDHTVVEEDGDRKAHKTRWKRALASMIAGNFRCDIFFRGSNTYMTLFVGKKADIEICKYIYNEAIRFIDRYFAKYWNEEGKYNLDTESYFKGLKEIPLSYSIKAKDSYARGFISRLRQKFDEQRVKAEKEGWGLVLVKDQDVVLHMKNKKFSGKLGSGSTSGIDSSAYGRGYKDCNDNFGETGQKRIGKNAK